MTKLHTTDFVAKTVRSSLTNAQLIRRRLDLDSELVGMGGGEGLGGFIGGQGIGKERAEEKGDMEEKEEGRAGNAKGEKETDPIVGLEHPSRLQAAMSGVGGDTGKIDSQRVRPYEVEQGSLKCESRGVGLPETGLFR